MVKLAPCCERAPPAPQLSLQSISTSLLYRSFCPSICLSTRWPLRLLSPFFLSPLLPPLILPSPISPSCHSGLPTGYRQGLNATRPSKHHGRMTGQRLGAPGDSTSPPKILTYSCGKAQFAPLFTHCWMLINSWQK